MVKLNLVKCRQKFGCLPCGKRPSVEESDVFKIKDDDDDDDTLGMVDNSSKQTWELPKMVFDLEYCVPTSSSCNSE